MRFEERKFWQDRLQEVKREMKKPELLHKDMLRWQHEVRMCKKHLGEIDEQASTKRGAS